MESSSLRWLVFRLYLKQNSSACFADILFEEDGDEELARTMKNLREDQIGNPGCYSQLAWFFRNSCLLGKMSR